MIPQLLLPGVSAVFFSASPYLRVNGYIVRRHNYSSTYKLKRIWNFLELQIGKPVRKDSAWPSLGCMAVWQRWVGHCHWYPIHRVRVGTESRAYVLSHSAVSDSVTPWTAAGQAPLSMGFSRQEYWSGWPCPALAITIGVCNFQFPPLFPSPAQLAWCQETPHLISWALSLHTENLLVFTHVQTSACLYRLFLPPIALPTGPSTALWPRVSWLHSAICLPYLNLPPLGQPSSFQHLPWLPVVPG